MSKAKRLPLYKAYVFKGDDKDPVIDRIHTMMEDEGVDYNKAGELSGVSRSTIHAWIEGDTKRPQWCTVAAVATALGYEIGFNRVRKVTQIMSIRRRRRTSRPTPSVGVPVAA